MNKWGILGLALASALTMLVDRPVAQAGTYSCPGVTVGSATFDRNYTLSGASLTGSTACAYGDGNINQYPFPTSGPNAVVTQGYVGAYPSPAPTLGGSPLPAGATLQATFTPGSTQTIGTTVATITGGANGTITFLQSLTNVFVGVKDGSQNPTWAVFYLGSVLKDTVLNWAYQTCNTIGGACTAATSNASGVTIWGNISAVPLPPAALLFGSGLFGMSLLMRRRRKAKDDQAGALATD